MSKISDVDQFARNPTLLADFCRDVIARIDVETSEGSHAAECAAMVAQLREISRSIERLEKQSVAIPDVLRAEKTRLVAAVASQDEASRALEHVASTLGAVLQEIRRRLLRRKLPGHTVREVAGERNSSQLPRPSQSDRLPRSVLRGSIVRSLQMSGGGAQRGIVFKLVETDLRDKFLPGDRVWLNKKSGHKWERAAENERMNMIQDGVLKSDTPAGVWELSEEFK